MPSIKDTLDNIPETDGSYDPDLMTNPEYLEQSSDVIQDALQKGFDVLQLENGDIVTTGTKIVVTQYRWDAEKKKMVKLTAAERKKYEAAAKKKSKK